MSALIRHLPKLMPSLRAPPLRPSSAGGVKALKPPPKVGGFLSQNIPATD